MSQSEAQAERSGRCPTCGPHLDPRGDLDILGERLKQEKQAALAKGDFKKAASLRAQAEQLKAAAKEQLNGSQPVRIPAHRSALASSDVAAHDWQDRSWLKWFLLVAVAIGSAVIAFLFLPN